MNLKCATWCLKVSLDIKQCKFHKYITLVIWHLKNWFHLSVLPCLEHCESLIVEVTGFSLFIQIKNHGYVKPNTSSRILMYCKHDLSCFSRLSNSYLKSWTWIVMVASVSMNFCCCFKVVGVGFKQMLLHRYLWETRLTEEDWEQTSSNVQIMARNGKVWVLHQTKIHSSCLWIPTLPG